MRTIALRFGETFSTDCGTIAAHQRIIDMLGYVWYGKLGVFFERFFGISGGFSSQKTEAETDYQRALLEFQSPESIIAAEKATTDYSQS